MTRPMHQTVAWLMLAFAVAVGSGAQAAQHAKETKTIAGTWTMSVDSPHGAMTLGLALKQEGKTITGTFASPHGDLEIEGEFADPTLKLATTSHDSHFGDMTFNAKLKADGTLDGYLSSTMGDMKWTAQRAKE